MVDDWRQFFYFYPRPPRGGRHECFKRRIKPNVFLSTPSARRATKSVKRSNKQTEISIHALREEGDARIRAAKRRRMISIHALREEGDLPLSAPVLWPV